MKAKSISPKGTVLLLKEVSANEAKVVGSIFFVSCLSYDEGVAVGILCARAKDTKVLQWEGMGNKCLQQNASFVKDFEGTGSC